MFKTCVLPGDNLWFCGAYPQGSFSAGYLSSIFPVVLLSFINRLERTQTLADLRFPTLSTRITIKMVSLNKLILGGV